MTHPAEQIVALRAQADARLQVSEFLDAAARVASEIGDADYSAQFAVAAARYDESARQHTVRLLAAIQANPDVEVAP